MFIVFKNCPVVIKNIFEMFQKMYSFFDFGKISRLCYILFFYFSFQEFIEK